MNFTREVPKYLPISLRAAWNTLAAINPRSLQTPSMMGEHTDESWEMVLKAKRDIADRIMIEFDLKDPIVEIGCGDGTSIDFWTKEYERTCYGIDICTLFIDDKPNRILSEDKIPLDSKSMGTVICNNVFQHCSQETISSYIAEAYRVLRVGGQFLFTIVDPGIWGKQNEKVALHGIVTPVVGIQKYVNALAKLGMTFGRIGAWTSPSPVVGGGTSLYLFGIQAFKTEEEVSHRNEEHKGNYIRKVQ